MANNVMAVSNQQCIKQQWRNGSNINDNDNLIAMAITVSKVSNVISNDDSNVDNQ
jgi:hypothetical protein